MDDVCKCFTLQQVVEYSAGDLGQMRVQGVCWRTVAMRHLAQGVILAAVAPEAMAEVSGYMKQHNDGDHTGVVSQILQIATLLGHSTAKGTMQ